MKVSETIRRMIPLGLKKLLRQQTLMAQLSRKVSPFLPELICVDVGASYYPHVKWMIFLNAPRTKWLAVEPNSANLGYLKDWGWISEVSSCTTGLSQDGGVQTLYVTNVDSGSSLLPPIIPDAMKHRITNLDYYFPVTERKINTVTLLQAMHGLPKTAPVFVKLDTQGTELSILKGAEALFNSGAVVGIELESTLLAEPVMKGSAKFWEACQYLEARGFELLHIKPISGSSRGKRMWGARLNQYTHECDAIFALRRDVVAALSIEHRVGLLAFYLTNYFFEEVLSMLDDKDVIAYFCQQGCAVDSLKTYIRKEIGI